MGVRGERRISWPWQGLRRPGHAAVRRPGLRVGRDRGPATRHRRASSSRSSPSANSPGATCGPAADPQPVGSHRGRVGLIGRLGFGGGRGRTPLRHRLRDPRFDHGAIDPLWLHRLPADIRPGESPRGDDPGLVDRTSSGRSPARPRTPRSSSPPSTVPTASTSRSSTFRSITRRRSTRAAGGSASSNRPSQPSPAPGASSTNWPPSAWSWCRSSCRRSSSTITG